MAKAKSKMADNITVTSVNLYKSAFDIGTSVLDRGEQLAGFSFSFQQDSCLINDTNKVRIRLNILLEGKNKQGIKLDTRGEFGIEYVFEVIDLKTHMELNNEKAQISHSLGNTLLSISYSTSRGIIFQETQKCGLTGVILPVIDPNSLMT